MPSCSRRLWVKVWFPVYWKSRHQIGKYKFLSDSCLHYLPLKIRLPILPQFRISSDCSDASVKFSSSCASLSTYVLSPGSHATGWRLDTKYLFSHSFCRMQTLTATVFRLPKLPESDCQCTSDNSKEFWCWQFTHFWQASFGKPTELLIVLREQGFKISDHKHLNQVFLKSGWSAVLILHFHCNYKYLKDD